jgi:ferredoxin
MAKWKIVHEQFKCIGCGACAAIEPKHWTMMGDKAQLLESKPATEPGIFEKIVAEPDHNPEAADSCPVNCIHVTKQE